MSLIVDPPSWRYGSDESWRAFLNGMKEARSRLTGEDAIECDQWIVRAEEALKVDRRKKQRSW